MPPTAALAEVVVVLVVKMCSGIRLQRWAGSGGCCSPHHRLVFNSGLATSIQIVQYRKPCGAVRNPPESVRIRPSTESVRIPNRHPRFNSIERRFNVHRAWHILLSTSQGSV